MSDQKPMEIEAFLASGSLLIFAGVTGAVLWHQVPPDNEKYAMLMLGALIGVVKDTFGRYFQATKGAAEQRQEAAAVTSALAAAIPIVAQPNSTTTTTTSTVTDPSAASTVVVPDGGAAIVVAPDVQADISKRETP